MQRRTLLRTAAASTMTLIARAAQAQAGADTLRIIVPLGPGTPSDSITRLVAAAMSDQLKRPIMIDNRPGANGVLAVQELMRAKPDGNTLMLGGVSPMAINMAVVKNLPYDPRRDITPIGGMYNAFQAYVVSNALPVKTFAEFVSYARSNPGKVSVASYSALTKIQFAALGKLADLKLLDVPYKSTTTAYTDVMAGTVDASLCDMATALNLVRGRKLRALAITLAARSPLAPELPTASETVPGMTFMAWSGLIGPAGMSKDLVAKLNSALAAALRQKEVVAKMSEGAVQVWSTGPDEFGTYIDKEIVRWVRLAKEAGIEPE